MHTEDVFRTAMASLKVDLSPYTFIDVGSGKGKARFLASDLPGKKIIGIEYAPGLHDVEVRNIASFRSETAKCRDIEPVHADALQYPMPPGPLVLFIFNALAPEIMADFLKRLDADLGVSDEQDRPVFLIYTNLRSVKELTGDPFGGLQNLRVVHTERNFILAANLAGSVARRNAN